MLSACKSLERFRIEQGFSSCPLLFQVDPAVVSKVMVPVLVSIFM